MASSIEENVISLKSEYPKPLKINDRDMTDDEYEAKILEWATNKNANDLDAEANSYKWDRQAAYPPLGEQFDKLWHDINNGTLDNTGVFFTALKEVKDNNPKPGE